MARYCGPVCKLCRREGIKLFLKGQRCFTPKCAIDRREYPPGEFGQRSRKMSPFGTQLREKQKARRIYGVLERPFRRYFRQAVTARGVTGENLLQFLESRLDNVVFRLGFATSRSQARQIVRHGHIRVEDRLVTIPSFSVKIEQLVSVDPDSQKIPTIAEAFDITRRSGLAPWVQREENEMLGQIIRLPRAEEIQLPVKEQLIVELYSR